MNTRDAESGRREAQLAEHLRVMEAQAADAKRTLVLEIINGLGLTWADRIEVLETIALTFPTDDPRRVVLLHIAGELRVELDQGELAKPPTDVTADLVDEHDVWGQAVRGDDGPTG